ncbi:MAG: hydroxymethylbilane synthase [Polyangiales bacterium]
MGKISLTVATRRSTLALAQTRAFIKELVAANEGLVVAELQVVTSGDKIQDRPLYEAGGKGLFVKEIEEALNDRRADFAVHSMKDLPAKDPPGLVIACVPQRADPRDMLLVRPGLTPSLMDLPLEARVGSSSLRRKIALGRHRSDLKIVPLRGNIDTRMRKLQGGEFDAIILAAAGIARLGVDPATLPAHRPLDATVMLPAVAQGTLAIQARVDDASVMSVFAPLEHRESRLRACAERGVLKAIDADCTVPLAAHATFYSAPGVLGDSMTLRAWLTEEDGGHYRYREETAVVANESQAEALGLAGGRTLIRSPAVTRATS